MVTPRITIRGGKLCCLCPCGHRQRSCNCVTRP